MHFQFREMERQNPFEAGRQETTKSNMYTCKLLYYCFVKASPTGHSYRHP